MNLYDAIAAFYENIFPSSVEKLDFSVSFLQISRESYVIDLGCATGEFARQLSRLGMKVTGVDSNDAMITLARDRRDPGTEAVYFPADMTQFLESHKPSLADAIFCMGNTLAYIEDTPSLEYFFNQCHRVLKPGGIFIGQILNYENDMFHVDYAFPEISVSAGIFKRTYRRSNATKTLQFNTQWTEHFGGVQYRDTHLHYCHRSGDLIEAARIGGFSHSQVYGNYEKGEPSDHDAFRLIYLEKD